MNLGFEDESIEFKETLAEKEEALKDICAILNKNQMGVLYFGVKNNGDVIGIEVGIKTESDFAMRLSQTIQPVPFYSLTIKRDPDNRAFLEVKFEGKNVPYRYKGVYYLRNGERSEIMPTSVLERYITEKQKDYSLWENSPSECLLSDLDENLVLSLARVAKESNRIKIDGSDIETILRQFRLLTKNNEVNKAGEALFSKYRPYSVKLAVVSDIKGIDYLDMQKLYGNLFQLIDGSYEYVLSKLSSMPVKNTDKVSRDMVFEIPAIALREIIVNMFAHCDYSTPIERRITLFPNRVEFYNPGLFPSNATPEEFARKEMDPIDKNSKILKVLFANNYIEHFGTGFTTIFQAFEKSHISYSYHDTQNGFCFTVYRKDQVFVDEELSEYGKVVSIMRQDNYITIEKIATLMNKSKPTISRYIKALQEDKKIARIQSRKYPKWVVLK